MRASSTWIGFLVAGCLTACQATGSPPVPAQPGAMATSTLFDAGHPGGATVTIHVTLQTGFTIKGAPPVPSAIYYELRDAGTNAVVASGYGGYTGVFSNVNPGTYYARIDAVDATLTSITVSGPQNSSNQVTVTGGDATYTTGFALALATPLQLKDGTGGSVPITITNPLGGGYGELVNASTGALISAYDSGTSSFHLQQVVDGTYGFWGMGRSGGMATLARKAGNVTVSGNGATVSGSWNLNIPNTNTVIAGGGASAVANGAVPTSVNLPGNVNDLLYDASGNLIFTSGNQVLMIPRSGGTYFNVPMPTAGRLYIIAGTGAAGNASDGFAAPTATLNAPAGLALNGGTLLIADTNNNRIRSLNSAGIINHYAGSAAGTSGTGVNGATLTAALFNGPRGILIDGANILVADTANNRIQSISGGTVTTAQTTSAPTRIVKDSQGNYLYANGANLERGTAPSFSPSATVASGISPAGLLADTGGHIYFGNTATFIRTLDGTTFTVANTNGASTLAWEPISGGMAIAETAARQIRLIN